jgi:hypothetical protein
VKTLLGIQWSKWNVEEEDHRREDQDRSWFLNKLPSMKKWSREGEGDHQKYQSQNQFPWRNKCLDKAEGDQSHQGY